MLKAPWTKDQVESLTHFQNNGMYHPFTHGDGADQVDLIATEEGWVFELGGPVVQDWCHEFMADWSWNVMSRSTWKRKFG
jgi:hypothetical protein